LTRDRRVLSTQGFASLVFQKSGDIFAISKRLQEGPGHYNGGDFISVGFGTILCVSCANVFLSCFCTGLKQVTRASNGETGQSTWDWPSDDVNEHVSALRNRNAPVRYVPRIL